MAKKKHTPNSEITAPRLPAGVKLLRALEGHVGHVMSVAFDPSGGILANGSRDNTVKLWEATSGKLLRTLEGHADEVDIVAFSPDGRLLALKKQ